jgi:hypothetical protein
MKCETVGCRNTAEGVLRWVSGDETVQVVDKTCADCGVGYTQRPALNATFTRWQLVTLPYSEVCMHMRVAGTQMLVEPRPDGMAQLWNLDGTQFSFPITAGEAGVR